MRYLREFASMVDPEWEALKNRVNIGKSKLDDYRADINEIIINELNDLNDINSVSPYRKLIVFEMGNGMQLSSIFLSSMESTHPIDIKSIKESFSKSHSVYYSQSYLAYHSYNKETGQVSLNISMLKKCVKDICERLSDLTGTKFHERYELNDIKDCVKVSFMYEI